MFELLIGVISAASLAMLGAMNGGSNGSSGSGSSNNYPEERIPGVNGVYRQCHTKYNPKTGRNEGGNPVWFPFNK